MEVRQQIENQENLHKKIATKIGIPTKTIVPKRTALADVERSEANSLSNLNNHSNGIKEKAKGMGPPHQLPKKPVIKKENTEKTQHSNNTKPPIKKQESILKNTCLEETKTTVSFSSKRITISDPDKNSKSDPQLVAEYVEDIFDYLRNLESKYPIREDFLEKHQSSPSMRAILVNWLVEVHANFKFCLETLHMCVAILDRYLQENKNVGRDTLQLVGTSAMFIASKYEEMYTPDLQDFVYICDDTFSKAEIIEMEEEILKKLDFSLGRPLSVHFLRRYNKISRARVDHHNLGKYILELALVDHTMSHVKPSLLAAATCCLSMAILNDTMDLPKIWTPTLARYSTYEYSEIKSLIVELAHMIVNSAKLKQQAVRNKYSSSSYAKISTSSKLNGLLIRKLTIKPLVRK